MYRPRPRTSEGKKLEVVAIAGCTLCDETSNITTRCGGHSILLTINPLLMARKLGGWEQRFC